MISTLKGRIALVTGASGGIGSPIAVSLAKEGAAVALGYGRNEARAKELCEQILAGGGRATALGADLSVPQNSSKLVDMVEEAMGPVDILVCNAGVGRTQSIDQVTADDFDQTVNVNLRAPFFLAQRVLPGMQKRGFGRILFISSVAAFTGGGIGPHYAASKAGLNGLTHFIAKRTAGFGVTVNALAPANITETGMLAEETEELRKRVPVGRAGRPPEVADLAVAILRNSYLTNQVISLDGGLHPR